MTDDERAEDDTLRVRRWRPVGGDKDAAQSFNELSCEGIVV